MWLLMGEPGVGWRFGDFVADDQMELSDLVIDSNAGVLVGYL